VVQNCVFLSHQHDSSPDVLRLSHELQFRGVVPWVDKLPGGFRAGDDSVDEACRVIREDSSAFALYLTEKALYSDFIRDFEIPVAVERRRQDPSYPIVVISPEYEFGQIKILVKDHFGIDLTFAHGFAKASDEGIEDFILTVARELLHKYMRALTIPQNTFELSVSSFESIASSPSELLRVDATHALACRIDTMHIWSRLLNGLEDVKREISNGFGRPRLVINGSKHFTAAFITGRVFNRFTIDISQKAEYWTTDGTIEKLSDFSIDYRPGSHTKKALLVEIATGEKNIKAGVDALVSTGIVEDGGRLQVRPIKGRVNVTDVISRSLAHCTYSAIDKAANSKATAEVHVFVAAPQAFFMTLGTLFQGMPEVHLYEWVDGAYIESMVVPSLVR